MKILVDMNLSPAWVGLFISHAIEAVHWSWIGDLRAPDPVVMNWARENSHIVFTHDLDFGAMLALTQAKSPSVIQVRTHDVSPSHLERKVIYACRVHRELLEKGALIVLDENRARIRILPLADTT
jgi:predicted nuclease of predicted toxin-antitoxin system